MRHKDWIGLILICTILVCPTILISQVQTNISVKNTTFIANREYLPLWFHANQYGKVEVGSQFLNITDLNINQNSKINEEAKLNWIWGTNLIAGLGSTNYYQINQLFAGVTIRGWEFKTGMFHDPIKYAGLSSTNGNLVRSGNARSRPSLRISNPQYKPVPYLGAWLKFKIEYDEGLLNDTRYVNNAHLHHKSLYFIIVPKQSWNLEIGLEHFVIWGGESSDEKIGKFPTGINNYLRYVFASSGAKDAPLQEQLNVAGNQLGTYQIKFTKRMSNINLSLYLSHPFESQTGVKWTNWADNLLGFHLEIKDEKSFVSDIVYEFTNTRHQGIKDSLYVFENESNEWVQQFEDYFLHFLYKSGYTYHEKVMGSPLFFPVEEKSDESNTGWYAIRSNRFYSHHLGISGNLSNDMYWKGLVTYIKHLGTYPNPYSYSSEQFSGFFEIRYSNSNFPFEAALSIASDVGNNISNNLGIQMSITKYW